jgi:hypothetical protein
MRRRRRMNDADGGDPRYRHWTAEPEPPSRYGFVDRLSDWYQGRRDGADGLPDLGFTREGGPVRTPSEQVIRLAGQEQQAAETLRFAEWHALNPGQYDVDQLAVLLKGAEEYREAKREALKAVSGELTPEAKRERRAGEAQARTSDSVTASRRLAEHTARRRAAEDEYRAAVEQVAAAHAALERGKVSRDLDLDVLETRKRWIHLHSERRAASLLRSLIRSHRAGAEMLDELSRGRDTEGDPT